MELKTVLAFNNIFILIIGVEVAPHKASLCVFFAVLIRLELRMRDRCGGSDAGTDEIQYYKDRKADKDDLDDLFLVDRFSRFRHMTTP